MGGPGYAEHCPAQSPLPVQLIHGTADRCALYAGGEPCGGCFQQALREGLGLSVADLSFACESVTAQAAHYRRANGCSSEERVVFERGAARCVAWEQCSTGRPVELCTIEGGGHVWPGRVIDCDPARRMCRAYRDAVGPESPDLDASAQMVRFFRESSARR